MSAVYIFDSPWDARALRPEFIRHDPRVVFTLAESASPSIYWPWVIKVTGLIATSIDSYYMWYSTDHDSGAGGIYLATAPHPAGPWSDHGLIFTDTTPGTRQTETPTVIWNEQTSQFHMYYQQAGVGRNQATCLATSANGRTGWVKHGQMLDAPSPQYSGDGHTGYARVMRWGQRWVAHHLMGGGNSPSFGLSYSDDGVSWQVGQSPLMYQQNLMQDMIVGGQPRKVEWNSGQVIYWNGRLLWAGLLANFASGSNPVDRIFGCAPISPDWRILTAPPDILLAPDSALYPEESPNYRAVFILHDDPGDGGGDRLWLYSQFRSDTFALATAAIS